MNKRYLKIRSNLGVISYTSLKYVEIILMAGTMLLLAKKIGPSEMGKSIASLLFITYSSYLALGMNTLVVKNFRQLPTKNEKIMFLSLNIQYFLVVSCILFILSYFFLELDIFHLVSFIAIANLFRSYFMAYFRVKNKTWVLNLNNILFSILLLSGVVLFVKSWRDYLVFWGISVWVCLFLYAVLDVSMFVAVLKKVIKKPNKGVLLRNLAEGIKLAAISLISTLLTTSARIVIKNLDIDSSVKGSYQFADNIGMAVFVGISSVVFYFTPTWISSIKKDKKFGLKILKVMDYSLFLLVPLLVIASLVAYFFRVTWYDEYLYLEYYIVVIIAVKLLVLLNGLSVFIYMGVDEEHKYIKFMLFPLSIVFVLCVGFYLSQLKENIYIISLSISAVMLVAIYFQRRVIKRFVVN